MLWNPLFWKLIIKEVSFKNKNQENNVRKNNCSDRQYMSI